MGFGPLWKGFWAAKGVGLYGYPVNRWSIKRPPNGTMTGGLPVVYQGHLASLGPFRERLIPAHEERKRGTPKDIGVPDCKTDNGEMLGCMRRTRMQNEMHMMT